MAAGAMASAMVESLLALEDATSLSATRRKQLQWLVIRAFVQPGHEPPQAPIQEIATMQEAMICAKKHLPSIHNAGDAIRSLRASGPAGGALAIRLRRAASARNAAAHPDANLLADLSRHFEQEQRDTKAKANEHFVQQQKKELKEGDLRGMVAVAGSAGDSDLLDDDVEKVQQLPHMNDKMMEQGFFEREKAKTDENSKAEVEHAIRVKLKMKWKELHARCLHEMEESGKQLPHMKYKMMEEKSSIEKENANSKAEVEEAIRVKLTTKWKEELHQLCLHNAGRKRGEQTGDEDTNMIESMPEEIAEGRKRKSEQEAELQKKSAAMKAANHSCCSFSRKKEKAATNKRRNYEPGQWHQLRSSWKWHCDRGSSCEPCKLLDTPVAVEALAGGSP